MKKQFFLLLVATICYSTSIIGMDAKTASEAQTIQAAAQPQVSGAAVASAQAAVGVKPKNNKKQQKIDLLLTALKNATEALDFEKIKKNPDLMKCKENTTNGTEAYLALCEINDNWAYSPQVKKFMSLRYLGND